MDREVLVHTDVEDLQGCSQTASWQCCYKSRPFLKSLARRPPPAAAEARQVARGWGARGAQGWRAGVLCIQACDGRCGL